MNPRDIFPNMRPAKGRAFLCANDLITLATVYVNGSKPTQVSPTNKRSIAILVEGGYLKAHGNDYHVTATGEALVDKLIETLCFAALSALPAMAQLQVAMTDVAVNEFAKRNLDMVAPPGDAVSLSKRTLTLLGEALQSALLDVRHHAR